MPITDAHVAAFVEHGFVVVESLLGTEELERALSDLHRILPRWEDVRRAPQRYPRLPLDGEPIRVPGPFEGPGLNRVSLQPDLVRFARAVIGCDDVFLSQMQLSARYAPSEMPARVEEPLRLDFGRHSLAFPREDGTYRIVECTVYYTDVTDRLGPVHVVSRSQTRRCYENPFDGRGGEGRSPLGVLNASWPLPRDEYPEIYAAETSVHVPAGGALIRSLGVFCRTMSLKGPGANIAQTLTFRAKGHRFVGIEGWAGHGCDEGMHRFLTCASPEDRALLGFPLPGDPYWTEETLRGVAARYPGMDMRPYREAFVRSG